MSQSVFNGLVLAIGLPQFLTSQQATVFPISNNQKAGFSEIMPCVGNRADMPTLKGKQLHLFIHYLYIPVLLYAKTAQQTLEKNLLYWVATPSRLNKNIGLCCKRAL